MSETKTKITTLHLKGDTEIDVYPNVLQDNLPSDLSKAMDKGLVTKEDLGGMVKSDKNIDISAIYTFIQDEKYSPYIKINNETIEFNAGYSLQFPKAIFNANKDVGGGFVGARLTFYGYNDNVKNYLDGYGFHCMVNDSSPRYVFYYENGIQYFNPDDFNTNLWSCIVPTNTKVKYRCKFRDDITDGKTYTVAFEENQPIYTHLIKINFGRKYWYAFQAHNAHSEKYTTLGSLPKGTYLCRGVDDTTFSNFLFAVTINSDGSISTIYDNGEGGTINVSNRTLVNATIEDIVSSSKEV